MQVASVSSNGPTVRSEIDGWTFEDASLLVKRSHGSRPGKIFIGYTPSPKDIPHYTSVLEMLADGWELLGPPERETWETDGKQHEQWSWWLQRESSAQQGQAASMATPSTGASNKVIETAQRAMKLYRSGVMGDLADLPEGIRDLIRTLDELARP